MIECQRASSGLCAGERTVTSKMALKICHFDPETGEDWRHAAHATEDCEAACYDCLMSYGNQRDHRLLDRKATFDILMQLARSNTEASPASIPRAAHFQN